MTIDLDELCRLAAQEMLADGAAGRTPGLPGRPCRPARRHRQAPGRRQRLRQGEEVTTGAGMVEVKAPRVDDRREGQHSRSVILPAYMRKSPKVTEVLPVLYLRGLSTGDFAPALGEFFGSGAGLSASTVNRLTESWQDERERWAGRDLSGADYVYWWVDGVHFNVRLEEDRLCCLVIVGVRPDGTKELVALADGYRESRRVWAALLRSLRERGLAGPVLAVGDGALGFWAALRDVFPSTKEQRCWVHKTANVVDALPKRLQSTSQIRYPGHLQCRQSAPGRSTAAKSFADTFSGFPKATAKIMDDLDTLLAFYDFPKEHWVHLRTSNPIESTFSTVRLRTRVTRGAGSRRAALAMAYKLLDAAQARWHKIAAPELVPLVRAGATFIDGKLQERRTREPKPRRNGSVAA